VNNSSNIKQLFSLCCIVIDTDGFVLQMVVDDVFSSLSGLTFDWNLMPDTESGQPVTSAHNVLRCIISRPFVTCIL